jgi:N-acetyl sugar amidotransferase
MSLDLKELRRLRLGDTGYQLCIRCIIDTTVPGVTFDVNGECNFCKLHDKLDKHFPLDEGGEKRLDNIIQEIKTKGKGKKYDCLLGVSGGRDSTYTLYLLKKRFELRPLAVHFNDGFGNPVAGENMVRATRKLGVDLRTISSDWRESKDLKLSCLKASTPDLELGTDLGIATALYGIAAKEGLQRVVFGQSFRTEGIAPLSWNYLDGKYLTAVQKQFGTVKLRKWQANDPGFNLTLFHLFYYAVWRRIKVIPILYYINYVRSEASELITKELDWVNPGAHYWDDLYQSLMAYVIRIKFNIDRRLFNYSALVRSGQMPREEALSRVREVYALENPDIIRLCVKRLGITTEEFEGYVARTPKTFRDYPNHYWIMRRLKYLIRILSVLNFVPGTTYDKYFNCGE